MKAGPRSRGKKIAFGLITAALALLLLTGVTEVVLRLRGRTAWAPVPLDTSVTPGGRLYQAHPTLGYANLPGVYDVVVKGNLRFKMSHDLHGRRLTGPVGAAVAAERPRLWTFGCSFTHGWSVNDEETYPWLLQERYPDVEVVNFAVGGYGTVHALLQLEEALAAGPPPRVATVAYAAFHDERNVFSRHRRKSLFSASHERLGPLAQPAASLDEAGGLKIDIVELTYAPLPGSSHLATINWLDDRVNSIERATHDGRQVTYACITSMAKACREKGVELVIATITNKTDEVREFCRSLGVTSVDISVNHRDPAMSNLPWDNHPSALAHREFARRLATALDPLLAPR